LCKTFLYYADCNNIPPVLLSVCLVFVVV